MEVVQANIADLPVDAIVDAASESVRGGGVGGEAARIAIQQADAVLRSAAAITRVSGPSTHSERRAARHCTQLGRV